MEQEFTVTAHLAVGRLTNEDIENAIIRAFADVSVADYDIDIVRNNDPDWNVDVTISGNKEIEFDDDGEIDIDCLETSSTIFDRFVAVTRILNEKDTGDGYMADADIASSYCDDEEKIAENLREQEEAEREEMYAEY